jgi:hypothetical protein
VWSLERVSKSHPLSISHYLRARVTFLHANLDDYDNDNIDVLDGENSNDDGGGDDDYYDEHDADDIMVIFRRL